MRIAAPVLGLLALAACDRLNMADQPKAQPWDRNTFFRNASVMQPPAAGSVAQGLPGADVPAPVRITQALLDRGQTQFDIDCKPCHGLSGDGLGEIVNRGFPRPPSLTGPDVRKLTAQQLYGVITNGHGAMYGYADRVVSADRWAVIAYLRALQASQAVPVAQLDASTRAKLASEGEAPPQ